MVLLNFLKSVKDQDLYAESRVVSIGRTLAYVEVTLISYGQYSNWCKMGSSCIRRRLFSRYFSII
ncbi:MAG: hypothetical protein IPM66_15400 [Acidobacteriota bacterium]|nr:MAG: hypothetical protein IPM66_15400 [Acidobacteriota bacterium]